MTQSGADLQAAIYAAYKFALYKGIPHPAALDVGQQVALILLSRGYTDRPPDELIKIAREVARRVVMKLWDARARDNASGALIAQRVQLTDHPRPNAPPDAERVRALRRVLAATSESDRELLQLKFVHGLTVPEMAEALGIDAKLVKARLRRAIDRAQTLASEAFRRDL